MTVILFQRRVLSLQTKLGETHKKEEVLISFIIVRWEMERETALKVMAREGCGRGGNERVLLHMVPLVTASCLCPYHLGISVLFSVLFHIISLKQGYY